VPGTTNQHTASINDVAALAGTSGALQQTLMALANCHGGRSGEWLDELETTIVRNIENMTSRGAPTQAVEVALGSVNRAFANVRKSLKRPRRLTIPVTAQPATTPGINVRAPRLLLSHFVHWTGRPVELRKGETRKKGRCPSLPQSGPWRPSRHSPEIRRSDAAARL